MSDHQERYIAALNKFYQNSKISFVRLRSNGSSEVKIYLRLVISDVITRIELPPDIVAKMVTAAKQSVDREFKTLYDAAKILTEGEE